MKSKKEQRIEKIQRLLAENGISDIDAEVLSEDIYSVAHEGGSSFSEMEERIAAMEGKYDAINDKLQKVARRLG